MKSGMEALPWESCSMHPKIRTVGSGVTDFSRPQSVFLFIVESLEVLQNQDSLNNYSYEKI